MNDVNWIQFGMFMAALIGVAVRNEHRITSIERNLIVLKGKIKFVARLAIKDEGMLTAMDEGFVVRESPERLVRESIRQMVALHGRPPKSVIERIQKIVGDKSLQDDLEIQMAIHAHFSEEALERSYRMWGGPVSAMTVYVQIIREAREEGAEAFFKDTGMSE